MTEPTPVTGIQVEGDLHSYNLLGERTASSFKLKLIDKPLDYNNRVPGHILFQAGGASPKTFLLLLAYLNSEGKQDGKDVRLVVIHTQQGTLQIHQFKASPNVLAVSLLEFEPKRSETAESRCRITAEGEFSRSSLTENALIFFEALFAIVEDKDVVLPLAGTNTAKKSSIIL